MKRALEDLLDRSEFDNTPQVHDRDSVREVAD
jgi:hypothetical protein